MGIYPKKIDADGPHGLSWHNHENIVKGFADADVPRSGPSPVNDFGYHPQTQYLPGQIGDGNGLGVGDWRFGLADVDPMNPTRPAPPAETGSTSVPRLVRMNGNNSPASPMAPFDNRNSFDNRFENWTSSPEGTTPLNPNFPVPPPESGRPLGFFTGRPMPLWTTPPPLGGLRGNSNASGDGNPFASLPVGPGAGGKSQGSATGPGAPAAPFVPSNDPNNSGSLADWIANLAGVNPENPTQPAPPPLDDGLGGFYRDDPAWTLQRRR